MATSATILSPFCLLSVTLSWRLIPKAVACSRFRRTISLSPSLISRILAFAWKKLSLFWEREEKSDFCVCFFVVLIVFVDFNAVFCFIIFWMNKRLLKYSQILLFVKKIVVEKQTIIAREWIWTRQSSQSEPRDENLLEEFTITKQKKKRNLISPLFMLSIISIQPVHLDSL